MNLHKGRQKEGVGNNGSHFIAFAIFNEYFKRNAKCDRVLERNALFKWNSMSIIFSEISVHNIKLISS